MSFPTRNENTLDLLITTFPNQYANVCSQDSISDHEILSANFHYHKPPSKQPKRKYLQYAKGDYESMRQDAKLFTKERYFNGYQDKRSVNQNWCMIKDFISMASNKFIPSKTTSTKKHLPWINKQIRTKMRRKEKNHKLAKQTGNPRLLAKWKALRAEIKRDIKVTHDEYVNNLIGDIGKNSKPFWKYINSQKSDRQGIPPLNTNEGSVAETDQLKAEALNSQFASVFTETVFNQIPFTKPKYNIMENILVTPKGVAKLLSGLNPSKSQGPDLIHPRVLKELANEISHVICHLFQQSLSEGVLPDDWINANICPLFKKKTIDPFQVTTAQFN